MAFAWRLFGDIRVFASWTKPQSNGRDTDWWCVGWTSHEAAQSNGSNLRREAPLSLLFK
jgi:hypothetical protein